MFSVFERGVRRYACVVLAAVSILAFPRTAHAAPNPPTINGPGTGSDTGSTVASVTPTFSWNSVSTATKYAIYISKEPYGVANIVYQNTNLSGTSFTVPSGALTAATKFRWNMTAFNATGESSVSNTLYFRTPEVIRVPGAPTIASPGTASDTGSMVSGLTPTFSWSAVGGAERYAIFVSKEPYGAVNIVYQNANLGGTSFTVPGGQLSAGTKYRWNMTASNAAGESVVSNVLYFRTQDAVAAPNAPTITAPGTQSDTGSVIGSLTPTFSWNSVTGAARYAIFVSREPYGAGNIVYQNTALSGTSFTLPSGQLVAGAKYRWNMTASNAAGESGVSNLLYFKAPEAAGVPSAPAISSPGTPTDTGAIASSLAPTFSWAAVVGATKYALYISKEPYGPVNIVYQNANLSGTSFTLPSGQLLAGTKYRWNMTAFNASGESEVSSHLFFRTSEGVMVPPAPSISSPGTPTDTGAATSSLTPTFTWSQVQGAAAYALYVSKEPYGVENIVYQSTNLSGSSFVVPGGHLFANTKYRWNMTALNSAGESSVSSALYFKTPTASGAINAPVISAPGAGSEPGPTLGSLTPTFSWSPVAGASRYAIYISKDPFGPANIVYQNANLTGTSFTLPNGQLASDTKYRWNMTAFGAAGESAVSNVLYFKTSAVDGYSVSLAGMPTAGGRVDGATTKPGGTQVTVTAAANSGYTFQHWAEAGVVVSRSATYSFALTRDRSLVANFQATSVSVTVSVAAVPEAGGRVTGNGSYPAGTTALLNAVPASGYAFVGWSEGGVDLGDRNPINLTVTADRHIVANFATTTSSPGVFTLAPPIAVWDTVAKAPKVTLTWSGSSGAAGYDVYRGLLLVASGLLPSVTRFVDDNFLELGRTYNYRIVARNLVGVRESASQVTISDVIRPAAPDLVADSLSIAPSEVSIGNPIEVRVGVRNGGTAIAPASQVRLALRAAASPDVDLRSRIAMLDIPTLEIGETKTFVVSVASNGLPIGRYKIAAVLIPPAGVAEENAANNETVGAATLILSASNPGPELRIVEQPVGVPTQVGDVLELRVRVAGGTPPFTFQWNRSGRAIVGSGELRAGSLNDGTGSALRLAATPELQQSQYSAVVTDSRGQSITSDQVTPRIIGSASEIQPGLTNGVLLDLTDQALDSVSRPLDRSLPTVVIVHGWQFSDALLLSRVATPSWMRTLGSQIQGELGGTRVNVALYRWDDAWDIDLSGPAVKAYSHGANLAKLLQQHLGASYGKPIHFIGHSLGTVVVGQAVSQLSGMSQVQVTLLDTPTKVPRIAYASPALAAVVADYSAVLAARGSRRAVEIALDLTRGILSVSLVPRFFSPEMFTSQLSNAKFVDNYYGTAELSAMPAVGEPLPVADENWVVSGANHVGVHEAYYGLVRGTPSELAKISGSGSPVWTSILKGLPARASDGGGSSPQVAAVVSPLRLQIDTPTNVANTTPTVRGQVVSGYSMTVDGPGAAMRAASSSGRTSQLNESQPQASVSADIVVPEEVVQLDLDLLVEQAGNGAWLGASFNGQELLRFRADAFAGEGYRTLSLPIHAFAGQAGVLRLIMNAAGTEPARLSLANIRFKASAVPVVRSAPQAKELMAGDSATLTVVAGGTGPFSYQWRINGVFLPGATDASLRLEGVSMSQAGSYDVVITNSAGSIITPAAAISVAAPFRGGRLSNLSILTTLSGSTTTFAIGTVLGGPDTVGTKPIVVRAGGPSLAAFGVPGVVGDPKLEFFSGQSLVSENDDWPGSAALSSAFSQVGAFPYQTGSKDAAIVHSSLGLGAYTMRVSAPTGSSGSVLAEIYDATPPTSFASTTPRLINVSVLKQIDEGTPLTAGFVIAGDASKSVLIRAVGPTLSAAPFSVGGAMIDPKMELFRGQTAVGSNDDWGTPVGTGAATAAQLSATFGQVGAFGLPAGSKDSALLATLSPGNYSVQVSGSRTAGSNGAGVTLIEVYDVPEAIGGSGGTGGGSGGGGGSTGGGGSSGGSATDALSAGGARDGSLAVGAMDTWTLDAAAGDALLLQAGKVSGGSSFAPYVRLFDPSGGLVRSDWSYSAASVAHRATVGGRYTVIVSSYVSGGSGSYRLHVVKAPGGASTPAGDEGGVLTSGGAHDGAITIGDLDAWTISLSNGDSLMLQAGKISGTSSFAPGVRLYDPAGQLVQSDWGYSGGSVVHRATTPGIYTAVVYSYVSDGTGIYRFHAVKAPGSLATPSGDEGGSLTNGGAHDGTITTGDIDAWSMALGSGDSIMLQAGKASGSSSFAPAIRLYDPAGQLVRSDWSYSTANVAHRSTVAGTYTAVVYSYTADGTGSYRLHAAKAPGELTTPPGDDGGAVNVGGTNQGTITIGDIDAWTANAAAGDTLLVSVGKDSGNSSFSPAIRVYDPSGQLVQSDWSYSSASVTVRASLSGSYTILVHSYSGDGTGTYRLTVTRAPAR